MIRAEIQVKEPKKQLSQLVQQAKDGCSEAFEVLVREFHMDVRAFVLRRIRDKAVADDLAQEVFLTAVRNIGQLKNHDSVRGWLLAVARNKLVDHLRATIKQKATSADELESLLAQVSLERVNQNEIIEHNELISTLRKCISKLKPNARNIVNMFYFKNQTAEQIALESQVKGSAIRMSLLRIRKALAKCIRRRLGEEFQL